MPDLSDLATARRPDDVALSYMRASPPTDLMGLAADLGIAIEYADLGEASGKIDRTLVDGKAVFVITINSDHAPTRQRFTLAHEIAHFIKHRKQLEAGSIVDNALYRSLLPEPMEWEANRYAAQLLMPLSAMRELWVEGLRAPLLFALRLGVSEKAAEIRLSQLKGTLSLLG